MYDNPWLLNDLPFTEEHIGLHVGFIYMITDTITGKMYIGKKIFFNKKTRPPLKGAKKRRISKVLSNWQDYYGSNETLNLLVEKNEKSLYKREILHLCLSKSQMSYLETKEIFLRDALLSDKYLNEWCTTKITKKQLMSTRKYLLCQTDTIE